MNYRRTRAKAKGFTVVLIVAIIAAIITALTGCSELESNFKNLEGGANWSDIHN